MADLAKALPHILKYEGGFVDDPIDPGGMTYEGIARRYFPDWRGWRVVDDMRRLGGITDGMVFSPLAPLVEAFYRTNFWHRFQGDQIPDQALADELMDQAVNLGVHRAVSHLQRAMNVGNVGGTKYPDIEVDGKLGPGTLAALKTALSIGRGQMLLTAIRCQQGSYYIQRMEERPANERFIGWFGRV